MRSKIMLAKEIYDKSEKQILQLEREWYAGRYLSKVKDYYDLNVMAALIYLLNGNPCMKPYLQEKLHYSLISEME